MIHNPIFYYLQLVIGHTIFRRNEYEKLRKDEIMFFWALYNKKNIDCASHIARYWHDFALNGEGPIIFGGLITPIAMALGHNLSAKRCIEVTTLDHTFIAILKILI